MNVRRLVGAAVLVVAALLVSTSRAGFDFSGDTGKGSFTQAISAKQRVLVGPIPVGVSALRVRLTADADVDVQVIGEKSEQMIVGWPHGVLNGAREKHATVRGMKVGYSGYNGGGTQSTVGKEWITIDVAREVVSIYAYGYAAGQARVDYEWEPASRCERIKGKPFVHTGAKKVVTSVGVVPKGIRNLRVDLKSNEDVDIQVIDRTTGKSVVAWPGGVLNGHGREEAQYAGTKVVYSGYNGVSNKLGVEYVEIAHLTFEAEILAYYYAAGTSNVEYAYDGVDMGSDKCPLQLSAKIEDAKYTVSDRYQLEGEGSVVLHRGESGSLVLTGDVPSSFDVYAQRHTEISGVVEATQKWAKTVHGGGRVSFAVPADAAVGKYYLEVRTDGGKSVVTRSGVHRTCVYVIFASSRLEKADIDEYLLRDDTRLWFGSSGSLKSMAWQLHQFSSLDDAMALASRVPEDVMRSEILATRAFSNLVNSDLLSGRWDGNYADGVKPSSWAGSQQVLAVWRELKRAAKVRYGQCWVFAGVTTSLLRALGVPTRPVTNFDSAHESLPLDGVVNRKGGESIWNFHVWNEVLIARPDVGLPHRVWNAIDATPQERSDGKYQLGPAAVPKVSKNDYTSYDAMFVASEVNADVWLGDSDFVDRSQGAEDDLDADHVGKFVSTLRAGCHGTGNSCREDLTSKYKTAQSMSSLVEVAEQQHLFAVEISPLDLGSDIKVVLRRTGATFAADNAGVQNVTVTTVVSLSEYSSNPLEQLVSETVVVPRADCGYNQTCHVVTLPATTYTPHLARASGLLFEVRAVAGKQTYRTERRGLLVAPDAKVALPAALQLFQRFRANVTVTNPLAVPLTHVVVSADTPQADNVDALEFPAVTVPPHGSVTLHTSELVVGECGRPWTLSVSVDAAEVHFGFVGEATADTVACVETTRTAKDEANALANATATTADEESVYTSPQLHPDVQPQHSCCRTTCAVEHVPTCGGDDVAVATRDPARPASSSVKVLETVLAPQPQAK